MVSEGSGVPEKTLELWKGLWSRQERTGVDRKE
jgi:hypothetical protein